MVLWYTIPIQMRRARLSYRTLTSRTIVPSTSSSIITSATTHHQKQTNHRQTIPIHQHQHALQSTSTPIHHSILRTAVHPPARLCPADAAVNIGTLPQRPQRKPSTCPPHLFPRLHLFHPIFLLVVVVIINILIINIQCGQRDPTRLSYSKHASTGRKEYTVGVPGFCGNFPKAAIRSG